MIADISTIIWKEYRENIITLHGTRGGVGNIVIIVLLMGVLLPWQMGTAWISDSKQLLYWSWIPIFLALSHITDSFAGERERHTLETLLSTRLSDQAILFGKLLSVVLYAWLLTIISLLLGAVTVNVAYPSDSLQFYPLQNFAIGIGISFLSALLISCIGVLVSLKSSTARQAYQRMSVVFLVIWFLPLLALQILPKPMVEQLMVWATALDLPSVIGGLMAGLLVVDAILVWIVNSVFNRSRLIQD